MRRTWSLAVGFLVGLSGSAPAADRCYLAIFAAETVPFTPRLTHTFVAAVRVPGLPDGTAGPPEVCHISWCAANLVPRGLTLLPEPGVNLPVADTFAHCRRHGMRVSVWGPYQIDPELFDLLSDQAAKLESGRVLYKPTDNLYHSDVAANCYHAIWKPVAPCRKYSGPFNCGDASGGTTVRLFRPWLVRPELTHDWLLDVIVPPGERVVRRSHDDRPTRLDAVRSARGR